MIKLDKKIAQRIQWLLIEESNQKYSQLKKLERTDSLGLHLVDRANLMIQVTELNNLIESLTESIFGSSNFAEIKAAR